MSGKPASVGASRAGVPGAPRVLVYVDPRQLEPGAAAPDPPPATQHTQPGPVYLSDNLHPQLAQPRNTVYRHPDQRNLHNSTLLASTGNVAQRPEFYPVSQHYTKDLCLKLEDKNDEIVVNKQENFEKISSEFSASEAYRGRIESADLAAYQTRCSGPLTGDTMPTIQQIALHHGQNQFSESVTVHGVDGSSGDRELSVGKSYVNYQILEQSVSHQSIVNQSISILNQQVGVSRGITSEVDSGSNPQLVRTADGVVLAVLPTPVAAQATDSQDSPRTVSSDTPQTITVPLGWRRIVTGTSVLYISPSGTALSTITQLREYLQTSGTCKCGLPCPLRPETAFSFDSKVVSKPYQAASGAELTKLCNHKRKLLATLQSRAQSPATPPPQNTDQKKGSGSEVAVLKKKMKRPGFQGNVSMSQLMLQRERPLGEFKPQEAELRDSSTGLHQRGGNGQPLSNYAPIQQTHISAQDDNIKQDAQLQRSSHYLTVNNGWITQSADGQKTSQPTSINNPMNPVGMPVLGTNGQIIGVNTGYNKNINIKNIPNMIPPSALDTEKDERKDVTIKQNTQSVKYSQKDEDSQVFCGLNQALTPEVMQKINEQQQIFIQQNQKQIEMAMKGYKTQFVENINQNKNTNQYAPQGQLVFQNGSVVKTNPAKTPPWQVKRNDSTSSNTITSPNPKHPKIESADYDEHNANLSEDSSSSFSSFSSNEQVLTSQGMCSRVPPLPQHYNMINQQWPAIDTNKKKGKGNKGSKKKNSPTENKVMNFGGNGMRLHQDSKTNNDDITPNNLPSFMDDPNGYLAQQTVLLNNTISRQVGINPTYDSHRFDGSASSSSFAQHHQTEKMKPGNKTGEGLNNIYRNNVPNPSPSPNTTPDSSVLSDKTEGSSQQCCKGCNMSSKSNSPDFVDNHMRQQSLKYMKNTLYKMELDNNPGICSPKQMFEDNPVTSSTFIERNHTMNENCSPIQGGTVSTSNVSHTETLQPPEPSPTLSNSSRSTDTPHSNGSNNSQMQPTSTYHMQSPVYSNNSRDNLNSNPPTPGNNQGFAYNSPGPPSNQSISGTQMMHFISNHNVNKNLMEVDNISMVGVRPGMKSQEMVKIDSRRRIENVMPGYCPPPHLGGGPAHSLIQACYVQSFVTTMASGFSVTRDTVTSVLAGKANTATTSINASQANFVRPPPPPSVNLATTYAIPNNQPDPFLNSVNLPTSYPLHIAGTTAQNMISKSPLEMVQNVIGSLPSKSENNNSHSTSVSQVSRRTTPGQILISSTGQIIVSNNQMPPPPPKTTTSVASGQSSGAVTNVSASVNQVVPPVGGVQSLVNQPTVVVNALQAPFVIQPQMMAMDGQVVQQNAVLPQIVAGGIVSGQSANETRQQIDVKSHQSYMQSVAMVSPESLKKRSKKKKSQSANITNVLQITAPQQNPNNILVHSSPQQNTSPQFSPRGFQLSPNNNISPPMLQALTIVPGKSGAPAHIVMNGQGNTNNFGSQQILTNTSPSQQINLLQPVNLINNASGVMSNFPAFQQFIVPNLGGMVMTADGTTIIQDNNPGMPMQLQLQTVNGQNVLTPVQNPNVFAAGANGGMVIRAQSTQGKIIQSQHSPGAQFLSPNGQVMMNSPNFNGQLSPLLANLSPTNVAFNAGPQARVGNVQTQEFIQTNQTGPALALPPSPKRASIATATTNRTSSTFVQRNTTIVQQQTTLVSNSHNAQMGGIASSLRGADGPAAAEGAARGEESAGYCALMRSLGGLGALGVRHSVSTQTLRKSPGAGASPPDTTTHSPRPAPSPRAAPAPADTTTRSPEPPDAASSAMVQCVSSSEQDMAEAREHSWPSRTDFNADADAQNAMTNLSMMRQRSHHNPVESTDLHYNSTMTVPSPNHNAHVMPMASNYYERPTNYNKRKNDFGDGSSYRSDKIMRTNNYNVVHGGPKECDYDMMSMTSDKQQSRHYQSSGSTAETSALPKVFDRHSLGSSDDEQRAEEGEEREAEEEGAEGGGGRFRVGEVVWGPVRGHAMWPGALAARAGARWRVRWFGARAEPPALLAPHRLLTLSEGLDAHHRRLAAQHRPRKSRKLNTLLENAIQEAMAELDRRSEGRGEALESKPEEPAPDSPIAETPKRTKKLERVKNKNRKKHPVKIAPNPNKTGEGARLRSAK